jgi:hypothetical protein
MAGWKARVLKYVKPYRWKKDEVRRTRLGAFDDLLVAGSSKRLGAARLRKGEADKLQGWKIPTYSRALISTRIMLCSRKRQRLR